MGRCGTHPRRPRARGRDRRQVLDPGRRHRGGHCDPARRRRRPARPHRPRVQSTPPCASTPTSPSPSLRSLPWCLRLALDVAPARDAAARWLEASAQLRRLLAEEFFEAGEHAVAGLDAVLAAEEQVRLAPVLELDDELDRAGAGALAEDVAQPVDVLAAVALL